MKQSIIFGQNHVLMHPFLVYYLPFYMVVFVLLTFVLSSYRFYKQNGINPITFRRTDTAHDFNGKVMRLLMLALAIAIGCFCAGKAYAYLLPIWYLEDLNWDMAGLVLLHASLVLIVVAQIQMGISWRIGIDKQLKTPLVTHKLYAWSRNPIYLGILLCLLGLFFILPNILTFFALLAGYFSMSIQIRLEEEFLLNQHGDTYTQYRQKVNRWFGRG
ncbi:MAG: isoprenylcysteine carboxylmethyltransferase family protein [Chitinophagales bacterium]|nr:isoprenylcysteine carboxylmethyltransferase family protein [Chitinophagales bacterium]